MARPPLPTIVKEAFYVASGPGERACFLRKGARGHWAVTTDIASAEPFSTEDTAQAALADHVEKHRHGHHGPASWRVVKATTRTVFSGA